MCRRQLQIYRHADCGGYDGSRRLYGMHCDSRSNADHQEQRSSRKAVLRNSQCDTGNADRAGHHAYRRRAGNVALSRGEHLYEPWPAKADCQDQEEGCCCLLHYLYARRSVSKSLEL